MDFVWIVVHVAMKTDYVSGASIQCYTCGAIKNGLVYNVQCSSGQCPLGTSQCAKVTKEYTTVTRSGTRLYHFNHVDNTNNVGKAISIAT